MSYSSIRLSLQSKSVYPVPIGRNAYLHYRPVFPTIAIESIPLSAPPIDPAIYALSVKTQKTNKGALRTWITSVDNYVFLKPWWERRYRTPFPLETDPLFQDCLVQFSQIKACQNNLYDESSLPKNLELHNVNVLPHQINGAWFLLLRARALLSDPVGLGKTLQFTLAWKMGRSLNILGNILIATQKSLLYQTAEEFERVTGITPLILQKQDLDEIRNELISPSRVAVIINHYRLRDTIEHYASVMSENLGPKIGKVFSVFVLDEAQVIKTRTSDMARAIKTINSPYLWLVTATPIENSLVEAHSLLQFLDPLFFGGWNFFQNRYCIMDYFGGIERYNRVDEFKTKFERVIIKRERHIVSHVMPKVSYQAVSIPMLEEQEEFYDNILNSSPYFLEDPDDRNGYNDDYDYLNILAQYTRLRQICDHPLLVDPSYRGRSSKLEWLKEFCCSHPNDQMVVFTQWTQMMDLIVQELKGNFPNLKIITLYGALSAKKREEVIKSFHNEDFQLLICTDAAKCGVNLPNARYLIQMERHFKHRENERSSLSFVKELSKRILRIWSLRNET